MPELRRDKAAILAARMDELLKELAAFTDGEEDLIEDGAESDPEYIDALSEAATLLDRACVQMARVDD